MPRGSKLSRPSRLLATKTSWEDSSMFERYEPQTVASYHALTQRVGSRSRASIYWPTSRRPRRIRRSSRPRRIRRRIRRRHGSRRWCWRWWSSNLRLQRLLYPRLFSCGLVWSMIVDFRCLAPIYRRMARSKGPVPSSW